MSRFDKSMFVLGQVKKTIQRFKMLEKGDRVLVAVSGGVDSMALFHIMAKLKDEYALDLAVIHLNHSLRGKESDADFLFVKGAAERRNIKFIGRTVNVTEIRNRENGSTQEVAREVRYRFFEDAMKRYKADKIATGHNLDDNAETVLMRLIKGTALKGISGIPPVRDRYIRPLIEIKRDEIFRYARENMIGFREDSSNKETKYLRNSIRIKLLPILHEFNPRIKEELANLAALVRRDEDFLERETEKVYEKGELRKEKGEQKIVLGLDKLNELPDALKARVLLKAVGSVKGDSMGIYSYHISDILDLTASRYPQGFINLPQGVIVQREYNRLVFAKEGQVADSGRQRRINERPLNIQGDTCIKGFGVKFIASIIEPSAFSLKPSVSNVAYFDYDKLEFPVMIRNFRNGDRIRPFGMKGTKKVKDIFIERKIPLSERKEIPILLSGGEIIWVCSVRRGEMARVDKDTKKALKIEIVNK